MYILKNALRSISRSKGRSILIGIIIFVIAVSSCVALSIREAAEQARKDSLADLQITAQITVNRQKMMDGQGDRESRKAALSGIQGLSLEDMKTYADSEHVKDFYYTSSVSLNGNDDFEPVDTTGVDDSSSDEADAQNSPADSQGPGMMPGGERQGNAQSGGQFTGAGRMGTQGDFTLTGYSSDAAMTDFEDGNESITEGAMFAENDTENQCIISEELAAYNDLKVGDTITLQNPNKEDETYTLTVSGIYENNKTEDSSGSMMGGFSPSFDSANQIYTSYENLKAITDASSENAVVTTDENTQEETTTALRSQTTGTYTFADIDNYESFKSDTEAKLGDSYTVESNDLTKYEQSLLPLENLSKYAGYFLVIILTIGGIILVVLNIFNIRERKYEIGVLAAIGMKKGKIAVQFILELLCVTFAAVIIGAGAGAAASVPVTNKLLEQQIESTVSAQEQQTANFGRAPGMQGQQIPGRNQSADYMDQISSATDLTVVLELIGIGILLTIISGCVAVVFILRYDPLRILSNRD
ncbi:MAG: ABC transporter permease [Muricomes sp.]